MSMQSKPLAEQNAVLNRFQALCTEFATRESVTMGELVQIVLTEGAHRLGHSGVSLGSFKSMLAQFRSGAIAYRAEHDRECVANDRPTH